MSSTNYKQVCELFSEYKKTRNEDVFKQLYIITSRPQYFVAYNYLNDTHLAQEAVQNMYVSLIGHVDTIENSMGIIEWMNRTTINMCHKVIEREKINSKEDIDNYKDKLVDTSHNPEDKYKYSDDVETLNKALNKLEPELKQLIIYRYVDNLKIKEISKMTNLSTATINRYISKATTKLKKYMKNIENKMYNLFAAPFMFALFRKAMNIEFSNSQMINVYSKVAKDAALVTSGVTLGTIDAKIIAGVAKKASVSSAKTIGGATAVAATAGVVAVAIFPNYSISTLENEWVLSQIINVSFKNPDQISNVQCFQGNNLIGELTAENNYSIEIEQNGDYRIVIEEKDGNVEEKDVIISNIDYELPTIDVERTDELYKAVINDTKSGINYNSISVVDQDNKTIDYSLSDNVITCINNNPITKITVYDNLGNGKRVTLYNE